MNGVIMRAGYRNAVVGLLCGCMVGTLAGCGASKAIAAPSPTQHATNTKGCPSGTAGVDETGTVHCFRVGASSSTSGSSSSVPGERASYQPNAHWPSSTNEAAQRYINAVVLYMNHGGGINFPKHSPLAFPLRWTTGLENGGGPSGSPIVLWQLSLPSSYLQWSVSEWQSTMNILETQEFTGGGANVSMGVLANSQGTAIDQVFQLLAPNGFVVRLVDGNSIPVNSVGVTMPVPTEALVWSAPGALPGASMTPLWDEWIPPITEYPQLTALAESHISAEMQDLKTSGQQIWQVLHPSSGASSSPSQSSSPSSNSSTSSAPPVTFGKTFPNLEGLTATQAASLLHAVNAHIGTSTSVYSTEPLNTIINQAPQPYASQAQGDAVTVTLSRGPSPTSARLSKNATATTWQIPNSAPSQSLLKIVVTDSAGNEEVFYQQVNPDQQVKIPFTWYGTNGQLVAFLNGQEQPPQPLAVNNSTPSSVVGSASPSP